MVWSHIVTNWGCGYRSLGEGEAEDGQMVGKQMISPDVPLFDYTQCLSVWPSFSPIIPILPDLLILFIDEQICFPQHLSFSNYPLKIPISASSSRRKGYIPEAGTPPTPCFLSFYMEIKKYLVFEQTKCGMQQFSAIGGKFCEYSILGTQIWKQLILCFFVSLVPALLKM